MLNRPIKMLVADDAQAIRSIFRKVAERSCGLIELVEAADGRECMKVLSRGEIDLAFIDVYMPEMSGLEALRSARSFGIRTFVTLMSGSDSDQFMELARQLRAYEFLRKPFGVRDIEAIMETYQRVIGPTKVLIVDDSMTVRKVVQQVLGRSIFRLDCYEAPDGETALAYCDRVNFDIIFLDCNMPGLDGLTTLDRLRLRNSDARVVMVSGEKGKDHAQRAIKRGAAAFLTKPFRPADIDAVLHGLFGLRLPELMTWSAEQTAATGRPESHAARPARASGGRHASARAQ